MSVVSNSSPLIALEQIRKLELLQSLFAEILIPDQVAAETREEVERKRAELLAKLNAKKRSTG